MPNEKQKSKDAFNRQAATYDYDMKGSHARAIYPVLLDKLSTISYQTALDLGCGTGEMMKLILERESGKSLYGIDLSENMLEVAKNKLGERAAFCLGDAEHLPYSDHTFDVVYCNDSFHHYPAPERVLAEIRRVLKTDGTFLLGDCWQPPVIRTIVNLCMKHSREGDVKIYSKQEIRSLLGKYFPRVTWERIGHDACLATGVLTMTDSVI